MTRGQDDGLRFELLRLRARNVIYSVIRVIGFALIGWGLFAVLGQRAIEYYQRRGSVPSIITDAAAAIPALDVVTAFVVFAVGCFIVMQATK